MMKTKKMFLSNNSKQKVAFLRKGIRIGKIIISKNQAENILWERLQIQQIYRQISCPSQDFLITLNVKSFYLLENNS